MKSSIPGIERGLEVPLLDLSRQLAPLRDEILAAVTEVLDSTRYILGPKVEAFEEHVAAYCGARFAVGVSSGTDALLASLMALSIGPGDLVLTTPYTFFATMGSILRVGARPVFVDIDPVTYNIDPAAVEAFFANPSPEAEKVRAIIPVHLYGQCADMRPILEVAERFGLAVIEDAAQAIGAGYPMVSAPGGGWRRAGSMGTAGCFSFFPSKNLGGIGDGGMVICQDEELAHRLQVVRVHGGEPKYYHAVVGGNFRLDPIQAAVLDIKLKYLPQWHAARRENAQRYERLFHESGLVSEGLVELPQAVYVRQAQADGWPDYHIYNQFVIRVRDRDKLIRHLQENGVGAEVYYPVPLHKQKCVQSLGLNQLSFPHAEKAAAETLALPIYPELTGPMQARVVEVIREFYRV